MNYKVVSFYPNKKVEFLEGLINEKGSNEYEKISFELSEATEELLKLEKSKASKRSIGAKKGHITRLKNKLKKLEQENN